MEIRELVAKLGIKFDGAGLVKAEQGISAFKASTLALTAVLAGAVAGIAHSVFSTIKYGDELFHTSEKIGIGVEQLQKFQYAAGIVDVSSETLTRSIGLLSKRLFEAQHNGKQAATALAAIGIKNPKGVKDTTELIYKLADKVSSLKSGTDKAGIVLKVFGRSGLTLIPFLNQGAEGMKKFGEEAQAMGIILDKETIEKSKETEHSLLRIKLIVEGLHRAITAQFIPQIEDAAKAMIVWISQNGVFIKQGMTGLFKGMNDAVQLLIYAFKALAVALDVILAPFGGLKNHIEFLTRVGGIATVTLLVYQLARAVNFLTGSFIALDAAAAPWLLVIAAISLAVGFLYLQFQDIVSFFKGKDSLLGRFLKWEQPKNKTGFLGYLEKIGDTIVDLINLSNRLLHPFSKPIQFNKQSLINQLSENRDNLVGDDLVKRPRGIARAASVPPSIIQRQTGGSLQNFNHFSLNVNIKADTNSPSDLVDKLKIELKKFLESITEQDDWLAARNFTGVGK